MKILKTFLILTALAVILAVPLIINRTQDTRGRASSVQAGLSFNPSSAKVTVGSDTIVTLGLNTSNYPLTAFDLEFTFDPSMVKVKQILPVLKSQVVSGNAFFNQASEFTWVKTASNRYRLVGLTSATNKSLLKTGFQYIVRLRLSGLKTGSTTISLNSSSSNLAAYYQAKAKDSSLSVNQLGKYTLQIIAAGTPAPTKSPTSVPTNKPTSTPKPKPTVRIPTTKVTAAPTKIPVVTTKPQSTSCTDSDNGINTTKSGTTCIGSNCRPDRCLTNKLLLEYYCQGSTIRLKAVTCPSSCTNQACK